MPCIVLFPVATYRRTTDSVDDAKGTTETVGQLWDSCVRFTLTGELVDSPTIPGNGRVNALLTNISADVRRTRVLRAPAGG